LAFAVTLHVKGPAGKAKACPTNSVGLIPPAASGSVPLCIEDVNVNYSPPAVDPLLFQTTGGTAPYTFAVTAGQLPPGESLGVVLETSAHGEAQLTGTPTTVGTYTFTVTATDSSTPTPLTASAQYTISVLADVALETTSLPAGTLGTSYSATLQASGGAPSGISSATYQWIFLGTLPPGLTLNMSSVADVITTGLSGVIRGTPTNAGSFSFQIYVYDDYYGIGSSASRNFTITISPTLTLSSLSPNFATGGGPAFTLTVNGSGFLNGSAVQWNGSSLSTSYVSGSQMSAPVPASLLASPGSASVTVVNPGGATSNALTFTIHAPDPSSTSSPWT
jgi:large repetitive protein